MKRRLRRKFFERKTLIVAKELLGKYLIRKIGGKIVAGKITETEAYCGPKDLASHASRGRTPRTQVMFGPAGFSYVYLIYGIYYCLNIVTEKENYPAAILIRGVEIKEGLSHDSEAVLWGPGKLCRELKIDKTLNSVDITKSGELWIEDRGVKLGKIKKTPRIGIDYAGNYKNKLWRFIFVD